MKKRVCALLLSAALCVAGLSGCAGTGPEARETRNDLLDPDDPVNVTVWHYYNSTQLVAFDEMVLEFNQTTGREFGIYVTAQSQGNVTELAEKVLDTARGVAGAGSLPDIFVSYPDSAYEAMELGLLADLNEYMSDESVAEYVSSFWQEGVIPPWDNAVIFPIAKSTEVLYLDAIAWEAFRAGVGDSQSAAEALATWEGVLAAAEEYYQYTDALTPDIEHDGRALLGIDSLANYALTALKQQGVDYMGVDESGNPVIDFNEQALRRMWDTYVLPMARGHFASEGRFRSDDVKTGVLMGFVGSSTGSSYFPDIITYEDNTTAAAAMLALPVPVFRGGEPVTIQQGGGMVVTKSDEAHEWASVVFLLWLTDAQRNISFATESSYLPVKTEALRGELMDETIAMMEQSDDVLLQNTAQVFRVALRQLEEYTMYYTTAFSGGLQMRYMLDDLEDVAMAARLSVLDAVAAGEDYETAVDAAAGDAAFQQWRNDLMRRVEELLASA